MKKRLIATLCLALCATLLCSCQPQQHYDMHPDAATQNPLDQVNNTEAPVPEVPDLVDYDDGSYDPASEEHAAEPKGFEAVNPVISSIYAGATPVVIDPIDKPTPTPVPPITFQYQVYDVAKLNLSFEGPVGWTGNDPMDDVFVLTNPDTSMDFAASLSIRATATTTTYGDAELKTEVSNALSNLRGNFTSFSPSSVDNRKMQDWNGKYANYTGVMADGTKVAGRVHAWSHEKTLYVLQLAYPQAYTRTYIDSVYDQFVHSLKVSR